MLRNELVVVVRYGCQRMSRHSRSEIGCVPREDLLEL